MIDGVAGILFGCSQTQPAVDGGPREIARTGSGEEHRGCCDFVHTGRTPNGIAGRSMSAYEDSSSMPFIAVAVSPGATRLTRTPCSAK